MNISKITRYSFQAFHLIIPQILTVAINLFTMPIILSSLDKAVFGKMHFVFAISAWAGAFTFIRISTESKIELSKGKYGNFLYSIFTRLKLSFPVIIIGIISGILLTTIKGHFFGYIFLLSLLNITIISIFSSSINNLLIAKQNFGLYSLFVFSTAGLSKIFSTVVVHYTKNAVCMFFDCGRCFLWKLSFGILKIRAKNI